METRTQALRKPVIPAKAGIQFNQRSLDSRLLPAFAGMTGNDEDGGGMPVSFRDTPFPGCMDSRFLHAFARMTEDDRRLAGRRPGSRGMTENDGLQENICLSLVRNQASLPNERTMEVRT